MEATDIIGRAFGFGIIGATLLYAGTCSVEKGTKFLHHRHATKITQAIDDTNTTRADAIALFHKYEDSLEKNDKDKLQQRMEQLELQNQQNSVLQDFYQIEKMGNFARAKNFVAHVDRHLFSEEDFKKLEQRAYALTTEQSVDEVFNHSPTWGEYEAGLQKLINKCRTCTPQMRYNAYGELLRTYASIIEGDLRDDKYQLNDIINHLVLYRDTVRLIHKQQMPVEIPELRVTDSVFQLLNKVREDVLVRNYAVKDNALPDGAYQAYSDIGELSHLVVQIYRETRMMPQAQFYDLCFDRINDQQTYSIDFFEYLRREPIPPSEREKLAHTATALQGFYDEASFALPALYLKNTSHKADMSVFSPYSENRVALGHSVK